MSNLTKSDYIKILNYYNVSIPKSLKNIKTKAKQIIMNKLCRCIKKVDPVNEAKSIGICKRTVLHSKHVTVGKFTCKKRKKGVLKKYSQRNRH